MNAQTLGIGDAVQGECAPISGCCSTVAAVTLVGSPSIDAGDGREIGDVDGARLGRRCDGGQIVVGDGAGDGGGGADGVAGAGGKGEGHGFIGLDGGIGRGIDDDGGGGGASREGNGFDRSSRADAGEVGAVGGRTGDGVVDGQRGGGAAGAGEGVDEIGGAIFCDAGRREGQGDDRIIFNAARTIAAHGKKLRK